MSVGFAPLSLNVVRGMTWNEPVTLKNDDGSAVDLTDATDIIMRVRKSINVTTACIELSITNERISIVDGPTGKILLSVTADDTRDFFPPNNNRKAIYVYDATIVRPGSPEIREPAASGKVRVRPQISRPWETVTG